MMKGYNRCKICGKILTDDEEFICMDCADMDSSGASNILEYIYTYYPLPVNACPALSPNTDEQEARLISRSILFLAVERVLDNPFDDPYDTVMDFLIELHEYERIENLESDLWRLDVATATLSDLRHYLLALGYGCPAISRY